MRLWLWVSFSLFHLLCGRFRLNLLYPRFFWVLESTSHRDPLFCIQLPATRDCEFQFSDIKSKALINNYPTRCDYGKCISIPRWTLLKPSSVAHPRNARAGRAKNHGSHTLELIRANTFVSPGSYKFHARAPAVKR